MSRIALLLIALAAGTAHAQGFAGLWKTYGDSGRHAESLVRIEQAGDVITGTVIQVFSPPASSPHPRCEACAGPLKDTPVVGLKILRAAANGEGQILDPDDGRVYRCTLKLLADGARLEVRGYVGVPLLGRTQIWSRVE